MARRGTIFPGDHVIVSWEQPVKRLHDLDALCHHLAVDLDRREEAAGDLPSGIWGLGSRDSSVGWSLGFKRRVKFRKVSYVGDLLGRAVVVQIGYKCSYVARHMV